MNLLKSAIPIPIYVILSVFVHVGSFPTDGITATPVTTEKLASEEEPSSTVPTIKDSPVNISSISTTSSLLFKDKKPILTYLLGQPKKTGGVSSPAQLLSPDRYEFFTFDDDGQIVKKLMSVKEIQRIIANNEKGLSGELGTPIEYYQILTVTPDVESIPSVSRINPNEPLFSIHDVIASVQNVLKSEIKIKQSQSSNETNYLQSASSDHFDIVTETSEITKTTKQEMTETQSTTQSSATTAELPPSAITHVLVPLVTSSPVTKPASTKDTSDLSLSTESSGATTTKNPLPSTIPLSLPLSLSDAHPALTSNDSFLDMKQIFVEEVSKIEEPGTQELKPESTQNFVKVETVERSTETVKPVESSTFKIDLPITPDLAESVSSVLWQIASANTMPDGRNKQTESTLMGSTNTEEVGTTEMPAQSRSTAKVEKLSESPLIELGNILIPQNQPRPFEKIPLIEKGTPELAELRTEPTTTSSYDLSSPAASTIVVITDEPEAKMETTEDSSNDSTTVTPQNLIVSVSPDAVVQSPEHLKPVTERVMIANNTSAQNQSQHNIEGIQVVHEANKGQIPRTTEYPGQFVKEVQRMEVPDVEESLANSATNTFSTQLPYVATETTTAPANEEKTEVVQETTEAIEAKIADDKVDITFVPMVIKTSSTYKQAVQLKAEIEDFTTTEKPEEKTEITESVTETPDSTLESKDLPEGNSELPKATEVYYKAQEGVTSDSLVGSLKQNVPSKPHFGKPQKPAFIKPTKGKPDIKAPKPPEKPGQKEETKKPFENHLQSSPSVLELDAAPEENLGLEATVTNLDGDVKKFVDLCNELAFSLWSSVTHNGLSFVRSIVVSPFAVTSLLAMVFLGARGPTSGQMNDILKLDDMVTFNPHLVFRNVTESLVISRNPGVATAAFVRELYSDKAKGKLLDFYKERVQQFYDGHVEEVNFKVIGDTLRRQTNHLVKRQTWGKITDFLRGSSIMPKPPLAAFSANIFQTDCTRASTKDRDGEMYFVILPASRLRRLVPIPAVVWRNNFLAGYEPNLDATAVSVGPPESVVSTIFVLPGQQGLIAPGDTLARLEHHLLGSSYRKGHWSRLMRSLIPRPGLELQIPRFSHKSVINVTSSLQRMGLKDLFSADKADLTGLNGLANDLHLSDMLQVNMFSTCGEEPIGARHHSEIYPATPILRREKSSDNIFSDSVDNLFAVSDFEDPAISALPLELRPRQARVPLSSPGVRVPEPPRLRFDRPFLFFVRHNPTGLILHMGRFNPRLMP